MRLNGVFAPIPTPFDDHDRVDLVRFRKAIARWMEGPLTGLVVLGSNGEAVLIDDDEADRLIVAAREAIPPNRPFIAGTGRESTPATVRATKRAADHGADAVLVRTPGFFKGQMSTDVFVRHYSTVADASPAPVLLYNFTALTGVNLPVAAVSRLAMHPNIIGVKESGGDIATVSELVSSTPDHFNVLAGSAPTFYAALCVGAVGGVLALSAVLAEPCTRLLELAKAGRHDEALALQRQLMPMARLLGSAYGVPGLKAALNLVGFDVGIPRPPLAPLPEAGVAALREALGQLEVIPA